MKKNANYEINFATNTIMCSCACSMQPYSYSYKLPSSQTLTM